MIRRFARVAVIGMMCGGAVHAAAPSKSKETNELFRVDQTLGYAQAWPALGVGWTALRKGVRLEEGALISLAAGDKVKIVSAAAGAPATFDLQGPLVFRLELDALRRIELSKEVRAQAQKNAMPKDAAEDQWASLDEAWRRISATFVGQETGDAEKAPPPKGAGVSGGIDLFLPQRSVTLTPGLPQELRLSWTAKKANKAGYRLTVKRPGGEHKQEVSTTNLDHQYVNLDLPGTYVVQVESTDGSMRSVEHRIEVLSPIAEATGEGEDPEAVATVRPLRPVNGFRLQGLPTPLTLEFSWSDRRRDDDVRYEVVVTTKKGVRVAGTQTAAQTAEVTLRSTGTYLWYVERRPGGGQAPTRSAVQTLQIEKAKALALKDILKSDEPVAVYFAR